MRIALVVALCLLATAALAQADDPEFLKAAIMALQAQRNQALDQAASLQAQLIKLQKELDALKANKK